ncbi:YhdP family protein [Beijerinckia mobilis]|uniref:YhdP family protein n=1 Tax=Beijerinckia mobilis TaxID=231434 RepID=UPI0012EC028D|nr:DUF3971 domain-containing protein [Beijerinckia mobilis]
MPQKVPHPGSQGKQDHGGPEQCAKTIARKALRQANDLRHHRRGFAPGILARRILTLCGIVAGLSVLLVITAGVFYYRLDTHPVMIDSLGPRIAGALDSRFGHGFRFFLGPTLLTRHGLKPTLSLDGFSLRETDNTAQPAEDSAVSGRDVGHLLLNAPRAEVSIDAWPLLIGKVVPKRLEIFDVVLRLSVTPDGHLSFSSEPRQNDETTAGKSQTTSATTTTPAIAPQPAAPAPGNSPAEGAALPAGGTTSGTTVPARIKTQLVKQVSLAIRLMVDTLTDPASPIAAIDRLGITNGRLIVDDHTTNQTFTFDNVTLTFNKKHDRTIFTLSVEGPNGRWTAEGEASGAPNAPRQLGVRIDRLSLDEILLAAGMRGVGADFDTPIAANFGVALSADNKLLEANGRIDLGAGFVRLDDPDAEPMLLDRADGRFHWDPSNRHILIDELRADMGPSHFLFGGAAELPRLEDEPWTFALHNLAPVIYGPERPGETPIVLTESSVAARLLPNDQKIILDRFSVSGADAGLAMAGTFDWIQGPHLRLGASINPTPVRTAVRLWPSFITAPIRAWALAHLTDGIVRSGTMQLDYDAATLQALRAEEPIPDAAAIVDFTVGKGVMEFLPGVPALREIEGAGHITGRTATVSLASGVIESPKTGQRLTVSEGQFKVDDFAIKPVPATITAKISGPAEVVGDLLSRDALKAYATLPLDPATIKGQIDGHMQLDMKIGPETSPTDSVLRANATVTNLSIDRLIGKERLENASLMINVDPEGLKATGQGHLFGAPANLEMTRPPGKPAEIAVNLAIDEAARTRLGIGMPGLTGTILAHATTMVGNGGKMKGQIDFDLTKAGFDDILPGVSKPAGKPAKLSLLASLGDEKATLDQIVLDAGAMQARGNLEFTTDMALIGGKFSQIKLSPGDDMKAELLRTGDTLKVIVRATTLDARPFLKNVVSSPPEAAPALVSSAPPKDGSAKDALASSAIRAIDLDIKADALNGHNKQVLSNADLHLVKKGDQLRQFSCSGQFGRDTIAGNLLPAAAAPGGSNAPQLSLSTQNAGALLSFIDLYKHMEHGRLNVTLRFNGETLAGALMIDNFTLRDEPAMKRLVSAAVEQEKGTGRLIDANAVTFHKLQVRFQRSGTRLDLREGTMYGDAIGLTVDGWLDYVHDKVDMHGTFVPAFAVNNLFSQIPVFGILLGGGANEGLFGINYRISGAASGPTLSVNPLSAIAPGFLRQMFGVGDQMPPVEQP